MHNINKMVYVGTEPWHGIGVKLPRNASYQEIAELAGFYKVIELPVLVPPLTEPVPDKKALLRGDDLRLLGVVNKTYRVVQFEEIAKTLVESANMVGAFFHTAGTLGPVGHRGWMLGELPGEIVVRAAVRGHERMNRDTAQRQDRGAFAPLREPPASPHPSDLQRRHQEASLAGYQPCR